MFLKTRSLHYFLALRQLDQPASPEPRWTEVSLSDLRWFCWVDQKPSNNTSSVERELFSKLVGDYWNTKNGTKVKLERHVQTQLITVCYETGGKPHVQKQARLSEWTVDVWLEMKQFNSQRAASVFTQRKGK